MTTPYEGGTPPVMPEQPPVDLPSMRPDVVVQGRLTTPRAALPAVAEDAWRAYDARALASVDINAEGVRIPEMHQGLAGSVANVIATSAGADYSFAHVTVGPRGQRTTFANAFAKRLASIAAIPETDSQTMREAAIRECEGALARLLMTGMKQQGQLVLEGNQDGRMVEQVWVRTYQNGHNNGPVVWAQEPLRDRAASLATIAVDMFWGPSAVRSREPLALSPLDALGTPGGRRQARITAFSQGATLSDQEALARAAQWARRQYR